MENPEIETLREEAKQRIRELIDDVMGEMNRRTRTADPSQYPTMDQLENMWSSLNARTDEIYADMVKKLIAQAGSQEET